MKFLQKSKIGNFDFGLAKFFKMSPYQQRVVTERDELAEKFKKLTAFFNTPTFAALPTPERDRLGVQVHYMGGYLAVLNDRIAAFQP